MPDRYGFSQALLLPFASVGEDREPLDQEKKEKEKRIRTTEIQTDLLNPLEV